MSAVPAMPPRRRARATGRRRISCAHCGRPIERAPSQIVAAKKNFCSNECHYRATAWSEGDLIAALQDLAAKLGRTPVRKDLRDHAETPSHNLYEKRFGTFTAALIAAGLKEGAPVVASRSQDRESAPSTGRATVRLQLPSGSWLDFILHEDAVLVQASSGVVTASPTGDALRLRAEHP